MADEQAETRWYSVRCVFQTPEEGGFSYEERVTLWRAESFDHAIGVTEAEASHYAEDVSCEISRTKYVGLAQSYWLTDELGHGAEVFSLIRSSTLTADAYLQRFFDTGAEHQHSG